MDPALSLLNPGSINFDCLNVPITNCEEEEAEADAEEREKALQDQLDNELDDGDIIDEDQASFVSELTQHSIQRHDFSYYQSGSSMSKESEFHNVQSFVSETGKYTDTNFSNENYLQHQVYDSGTQTAKNGFVLEKNTNECINQSVNFTNTNEQENAHFSNFRPHSNSGDVALQYDHNTHPNSQIASYEVLRKLQEEYRQLQILHQTRGQELEEIKRNEMKFRSTTEKEIKFLEHKLSLLQSEKDNLVHSLQQSEQLVSDKNHDVNVLQGKVSTLELMLSSAKEAKENALSLLDSREITIQSLEQQLSNYTHNENFSRLHDQHNRIMEDLKLRHQKECLQLKEEIDELLKKYDSKVQEAQNLEYKVSHLEQAHIEKSSAFNKLSASLEASQRQCQQLLESGTISEVSILKLQLQHMDDEKMKIEKERSSLKEEVRSLQWELKCRIDNAAYDKGESEDKAKNINKIKSNGIPGKDNSDTNLHRELERALQNLRSQRSSYSSLKKELENTSNQLLFSQEKYKFLESQLRDKENKITELEIKLKEFSSSTSLSAAQHENEFKGLQEEIADLQKTLQLTTAELKEIKKGEEALSELNHKLRNDMASMTTQHEEEIIKHIEESRAKCFSLYENAVKKLTQQFSSKADEEIKKNCTNYENKIDELQREIKLLNDQLYDAKSQYVNASEENQALQAKINELKLIISKTKQEIEKEVKMEYDKKANDLNEYYQKQSKELFKNELKNEISKAQEEWTKQKLEDIKEFVAETKSHLGEEFSICLEKERDAIQKHFTIEKENICLTYENKIKVLKRSFEQEKGELQMNWSKSLQLKSKEIEELELKSKELEKLVNLHNEQDVQKLRETFEKKISTLEEELRSLQKTIFDQETRHQQENSNMKQEWEKEKIKYFNNEKDLKKKLNVVSETEKKLSEELKRYQKHVSSISKQHKEQTKKLSNKISEFELFKKEKEQELNKIKESHSQKILEIQEKHNKAKVIKKNSSCQTAEEIISITALANIQEVFLSCLKQIEEKIRARLLEYRKQSAERLKQALSHYHNQLISKVFQDVSNGPVHSPTICISQSSLKSDSNNQSRMTGLFSSRNRELSYKNTQGISTRSGHDFLGAGDEPTRQNSQFDRYYGMMSTPSSNVKDKKVDFMTSPSFFNDVSFDFMPIPETASAPSLLTNKLSFV